MFRFAALCFIMALLLTGCVQKPAEKADTEAPGTVTDTVDPATAPAPVFPVHAQADLASTDLTTLVFRAECSAVSDDGKTAEVTVKVGITCWEIDVGSRTDGYVRVNGTEQTFTSQSLRYTTRQKTAFSFATLRFTVPIDPQDPVLHVEAGWHFNGSYSGQPVNWLTAVGEIKLWEPGQHGS